MFFYGLALVEGKLCQIRTSLCLNPFCFCFEQKQLKGCLTWLLVFPQVYEHSMLQVYFVLDRINRGYIQIYLFQLFNF